MNSICINPNTAAKYTFYIADTRINDRTWARVFVSANTRAQARTTAKRLGWQVQFTNLI